jgi:hypothetical protein
MRNRNKPVKISQAAQIALYSPDQKSIDGIALKCKMLLQRMHFVFIIFTFAISTGCTREKQSLDKTTRQMIEGLARLEMVRLDDSLKRVCDSLYHQAFLSVKDSLYTLRQLEMQQIINEESQ